MDRVPIICSCTQQDLNKLAGDEANQMKDVVGVEVKKIVEKKVLILDDSICATDGFREETITTKESEDAPEVLVKAGAVDYNPMEKINEEKFAKFSQLVKEENV